MQQNTSMMYENLLDCDMDIYEDHDACLDVNIDTIVEWQLSVHSQSHYLPMSLEKSSSEDDEIKRLID